MDKTNQSVTQRRVAPPTAAQRIEFQILSEILAYQGERQITGTIKLKTKSGRQVHLWTLDNDEQLLFLVYRRRVCHWEPTREPLEQLHHRACDWLTEPETPERSSVP